MTDKAALPEQYAEQPPPYEAHVPAQPLINQPGNGQPPTVINAVVVTAVGLQPTPTTCNQCREEVVTRLQYTPSMRTHLAALLLCLIGCWPCACVPYCMDSCNNINHYCPKCNSYLGTYQN